jgi:quercetin dioxygenase-like cupin family protein
MGIVKRVDEILDEPHPFLGGVTMKTLLSNRDDGAEATCIVVRCPRGSEIEEHTHLEQDDIIYVLEGEATMWIEGLEEFKLEQGTFVSVLKGRRHRTYDVKEDLLIYDVFSPPIF